MFENLKAKRSLKRGSGGHNKGDDDGLVWEGCMFGIEVDGFKKL